MYMNKCANIKYVTNYIYNWIWSFKCLVASIKKVENVIANINCNENLRFDGKTGKCVEKLDEKCICNNICNM